MHHDESTELSRKTKMESGYCNGYENDQYGWDDSVDLEEGHTIRHPCDDKYRNEEMETLSKSTSRRGEKASKRQKNPKENGVASADRKLGNRSTSLNRRCKGKVSFDGDESITVSDLQLNASAVSGNYMDGSHESVFRTNGHRKRRYKDKIRFDAEKSTTVNDLQLNASADSEIYMDGSHDSIIRKKCYRKSRMNRSLLDEQDTFSLNDSGETNFQPSKIEARTRRSGMLAGQDSIITKSSGGTRSSHRRKRAVTRTKSQKSNSAQSSLQFETRRSWEKPPKGKPGNVNHHETRCMDTTQSENSQFAKGNLKKHRANRHTQQPALGERQRSRSRCNSNVYRRANSAGPPLRRGRSMDRSLASHDDAFFPPYQHDASRQGMKRSKSLELRRNHDRCMRRAYSHSSRPNDIAPTRLRRGGSSRPSITKSRSGSTTKPNHVYREFSYDKNGRRFTRAKKKKEENASRTLVFIWIIVAAELAFDLATTVIAFLSFVRESDCCGESIELVLGNASLGMTIPFFGLVIIELLTLIRIIFLTLWPGVSVDDDTTDDDESDTNSAGQNIFRRCCCYFLKMNAKALMGTLNYVFLLNPIFGCMIAWMLMYQSDKNEAFIVLGLEGASLILHFASVCLEGSFWTSSQIILHLTPIIPFLVSISMVGYYIKQGGVCYLPQEKLFRFYGCEICYDGGIPEPCRKGFTDLWIGDELPNSLQDIGNILTKRTDQGTYCSAEVNFCFFNYTTGKIASVRSTSLRQYTSSAHKKYAMRSFVSIYSIAAFIG